MPFKLNAFLYLCSEISLPYAYILDNFNSDFNFDLILTLNVPIYKFQYQSMFCLIFKQITICLVIMQILYSYQFIIIVILMHNTVI